MRLTSFVLAAIAIGFTTSAAIPEGKPNNALEGRDLNVEGLVNESKFNICPQPFTIIDSNASKEEQTMYARQSPLLLRNLNPSSSKRGRVGPLAVRVLSCAFSDKHGTFSN